MSAELDRFVALCESLGALGPADARTLSRSKALQRLLGGEPVEAVSTEFGMAVAHLNRWTDVLRIDGFYEWIRKAEPTESRLARARIGVAQMLLGELAEQHFENVAARLVGEQGYRIEDHRVGRTDTDYRLLTPDGRALFRLNIKFHGTLFAQAREYVNLEPKDCFALATYKISAALKKQDEEGLPYLFLIVSVPDFPSETIQRSIDAEWVWLASVTGRNIEEAVVKRLIQEPWVEPLRRRLAQAEFRVLSARRANNLMRDLLFERVHALRLRGFNRLFRGAEINMHLSMGREMIGYEDLLRQLIERGPTQVSVRLDRGEI